MKLNTGTYKLTNTGPVQRFFFLAGAAGIILSVIGYLFNARQFFYSWLTSFAFWMSIALGGLFLTLLHHLTGSVWSVVLRRLFETLMKILPLLILFFIPVALGIHELYHWSHEDAVAGDLLLQKKSPYLNVPFFIVRTVLYFFIWFLLGRGLYKNSISQDKQHEEKYLSGMKRTSALGVILFAVTISFAAFDWLMSLNAHWYSTIFGVYYFAGSTMAVLAFITLLAIIFRGRGILEKEITVEHYHDLGKLLFTFTVFWGYIAFSQYFLIWYANIPEETVWYQHRWVGSWKAVSLLLVFGHFVVPFFTLMIRASKRNLKLLIPMTIWILLMHWVDLYWIVLPSLYTQGVYLSWIDFTTFIGIGGIFTGAFFIQLGKHALVPVNDPKLEVSINIKNY
ncbi:hypothetical protein JXQ31_12620 [candidate division KSB1 bacterium]|nr:hypothetical protein [candidate division KSB1 bacterium]